MRCTNAKLTFCLIALTLGGSACGARSAAVERGDAAGARSGLLLSNVRVFDAASGTFTPPVGILIRDGIIQAVGPVRGLPAAAEEFDAGGAFALPGLWDSHVHVGFRSLAGADSVKATLEGFVQSGVLYLRDVGGPLDVMSAMVRRVRSGEVAGPEIFFSGPLAERPPLFWGAYEAQLPGVTAAVATQADADSLVAAVARAGGSYVKAFGKWDVALLRRVVRRTGEAGLGVVVDPGPPFFQDVPIDTALAVGATSIEHAIAPWQSALPAALKAEHDRLAADPDGAARAAFVLRVAPLGTASLDGDALRSVAGRMAAAGAFFTPTLSVVEAWRTAPPTFPGMTPEDPHRHWNGFADASTRITQVLAEHGVKLLIGQDGADPQGTVAEMELLAAIGIPPAAVIRAATLHPAQWMRMDDRTGSLQAGRRADVILVAADPLRDMSTLRSPLLVLQRGVVRHRTGTTPAGTTPAAAASAVDSLPFYPADLDAPGLARLVDERLAAARAAIDRMLAVAGPRTADNTLRALDDAYRHTGIAGGLVTIAINLHPDGAMRAEGLRAQARIGRLNSELARDPRIAQALAALDTGSLTAEERLFAARVLRGLRRAGADRDEATRERLRSYMETLGRLGTAFARNLAEDTTTFLAEPDELAGMPPDWIAAHARDAQGRVVLTSRYWDFVPITQYATNRELRRRAVVAFVNRGRPANVIVLDSLLHMREAVAHLLGYPTWAAYQAETRMAGSPDSIRAFVGRVHAAAAPARERLAQQYLARLRRDDPSLTALRTWDLPHAAELTRRERYALDGREVRAYFPFATVKAGLLELAGELFGLEFVRVPVPVWHPDVEAYEAREDGRLIGRFYLDLHPRPDKYTHFAVAGLRTGIAGRQLPEAVLMANFPGGSPGDPGLLEHGQGGVVTFFHEFGHLLHVLFAVRPYGATAWPDEQDFNEAPSQMLEEWAWHPAVLRRITRHHETRAPIPQELVLRMQQADAFDRPVQVGLQTTFSAMLLALHDRPAAEVDADAIARRAFSTYLGVEVDPAMHPATSLDHVGMSGYSSTYYTYLWSQVIARDLWSAFDPAHPLDPEPARRYRDTLLRPGGSRPAARLIEDFLGRPFGFASWQRWVEGR